MPSMAAGLALVFDMDGVLVDSNPIHVKAWEEFNGRYGLETTGAMLQRMYGRRNDEIVREYFGDLGPEEIAARGAAKERLYREMMACRLEEALVPGIRCFLERHRGLPMAVASNAERANLDFVLERAGLASYFVVAVDGNQVGRPKPDPEIYLRTAELLGIAPGNCVVFEDSFSGVKAARAAGTRVVGLLTTHSDLPEADLTIDNFRNKDLEAWLAAQRAAV